MSERTALIAVSYVVIRRGSSVLLQRRQDTGYMDGHWATAAAGHLEAGEFAEDAALREAKEELGVNIDAEDLIPLTVMHRTQPHGPALAQRVDFFFSCEKWEGELGIMETDKAADLRWFPLNELPIMTVPHERYVLEHLETGLARIVNFESPRVP